MIHNPPTRSGKDYLLPFFIIVAIGVIAALLMRLVGMVGEEENSGLALSGKAQLSEVAGGVEVFLPAAEAWKITEMETSLNIGESVRTDSTGTAVLTFDDGSVVSLQNSSEVKINDLQNSITKKKVQLEMVRGSALVAVGTMNADFEISSQLLQVRNTDGQFFLSVDEKGEIASAITGGFVATILDPQNSKNPEIQNFVVETDQTVEISQRRVNLLRIGGDIDLVKETSPDIVKRFAGVAELPESSDSDSEDEDSSLDDDTITTDAAESGEAQRSLKRNILTAPLITTGGGNITAVAEPVKVSGKVSPEIAKIEVTFEGASPFALSQFEAGSGEWSYNASRDFENLKVGINNYSVVGFDADGNESPIANFQITFNPEGIDYAEAEISDEPEAESEPAIESTDGVPSIGGETFAAPVVTAPTDGETFTEAPVAFSGTVPAGTAKVIINEYQLSSFTLGDTTWKYNADPKYENLDVGENEFEIIAVNEAGDRGMTTIKITFTPEAEEE